ncbi:hypothetical protein L596_028156 [Steinernema carpocapsae]|uniref:Uncharacterized protein n=1 Tax=Steinernema carpocapsae TaxID=34508 RepID=A0A4U5LXL3_STECR|nr:hypothetical protein L596_028156 [Steinernema carpocapsae]
MIFVTSPLCPDSGFNSPSCSKSLSLPCFSCGCDSRAFRRLEFSSPPLTMERGTQTDSPDTFSSETAAFIARSLADMGDRFEMEYMGLNGFIDFIEDPAPVPNALDCLVTWISQLWS